MRKDRLHESLRDYATKQVMVRQLSRLLEQCHSMFSGSLAFLAGLGRFPQGACERRIHASRRLMPHIERDDDGSLRSEPHEEIGDDVFGEDGAHNPRGV